MHSFSSGSGAVSALPPRVQRGLMGSLVMCAYGERKKEFLTQVSVKEFLGESIVLPMMSEETLEVGMVTMAQKEGVSRYHGNGCEHRPVPGE